MPHDKSASTHRTPRIFPYIEIILCTVIATVLWVGAGIFREKPDFFTFITTIFLAFFCVGIATRLADRERCRNFNEMVHGCEGTILIAVIVGLSSLVLFVLAKLDALI